MAIHGCGSICYRNLQNVISNRALAIDITGRKTTETPSVIIPFLS